MPFARKSAKPQPTLDEVGLYDYAIKALGRRMRTASDLKRAMKTRLGPLEPAEKAESKIGAVLARLKEYGYLDDQSFAETYARLRLENQKLGRRRVQQSLQRKGVAQEIVNEVVTECYAETDEESLARAHLERKRIRKPENEKETARVMRRLVMAGFSVGVIGKILRQWDVPEEALAALENLDEAPAEE